MEIKHIRDIRELYDRRLEKVNQLYIELAGFLQQVERQRQGGRKRRLLPPFMKKMERRRPSNQSTTPTSPECSLTSPDSPKITPAKAPLYATLNPATDSVTQTTTTLTASTSSRKRHHRTNSGSPRGSRCSRSSSSRASVVVDAETQTDCMDISETDMSPTTSCPTTSCSTSTAFPQRVILQQFTNGSDDEGVNGNSVQVHYMVQHPQPPVPVFTRVDSRSTSPIIFDSEDSVNRNIGPPRASSEEDNLERIGRKVSEIKIGSIFSPENGNISDDIGEIIRQRACSETRDELDSTEDAANEDSFTDEEGEIYNNHLRRKSKPGREAAKSRYVDDIFAVFDTKAIMEHNEQLPFLDVLVIRNSENKLEFDVYRKETATLRYIPNDSHHPFQHKMASFNFLIHRFFARRPIYPGRRSNRYKLNLSHYQREPNASDEGNTSEYSVSPSSKSSTLESNPDRIRGLPNLPVKRPNESLDGSSDSESEENLTVVTQISYNMNKTENVV
ncbi:hypothetical protein NQ318_003148 [Aromia moschata]|uniref:Uncharacterized protein n=1 Tax=Aromia moschata TaxID=1265417 RepID=A0AAV8YUM0_9CUCU|nr:hypothetical protein NQ318_003148 [Aromia moschata]